MSYRVDKLFAPSRNGKESENPVLRKSGPVTLTFDLWPWNYLGFLWLSSYMFAPNFIKLSAAVHEFLCAQRNKKNSGENNTVGSYQGQ